MNKLLVKNVSLFGGGIMTFIAGIFYVLMTDLKMGNKATWLFIGIILALGSSIMFLLCENAKEKMILYYCLKGGSVLLSIGFVVFLFVFKASDIIKSINLPEKLAQANAIIIVSLVLIIIGILLEATNIVFSYLTRNEE